MSTGIYEVKKTKFNFSFQVALNSSFWAALLIFKKCLQLYKINITYTIYKFSKE